MRGHVEPSIGDVKSEGEARWDGGGGSGGCRGGFRMGGQRKERATIRDGASRSASISDKMKAQMDERAEVLKARLQEKKRSAATGDGVEIEAGDGVVEAAAEGAGRRELSVVGASIPWQGEEAAGAEGEEIAGSDVSAFFERTLRSCLSDEDTPAQGTPIIGRVYLHTDRGFAFLEFPSIQMTSTCMQLDGVMWKGNALKHRIYVGGLPAETKEADLRPIFEQFGAIQKFDLVPDLQNPLLCRGYCFVDYQNPVDAPKAIEALHGKPYGSLQGLLKVQFANVGSAKPSQPLVTGSIPQLQMQVPPAPVFNADDAIAAALAMTHAPAPTMLAAVPAPNPLAASTSAAGSVPPLLSTNPPLAIAKSNSIVLMNMVPLEELADDGMYSELVEEISEECRKFGNLLTCVVPRDGAGKGKVYLQYEHESMASTALRLLNGRRFGDAVVNATFYAQDRFSRGEFE
eukprot:g5379.t1